MTYAALLISGAACAHHPPPPSQLHFELSESGMGAFIAAPESAKVHAEQDHVIVEANDGDFELHLFKGHVSLQVVQAELLDELGTKIDVFEVHDETTLVYRLEARPDYEYGFVMNGVAGDLEYHCRTPVDGRFSQQQVDFMRDACRSIRGDESKQAQR